MTRRSALILLSVSLCGLAGATSAMATTPGHWTRITDATGASVDEVSLARTADGALHVAWTRPAPAHPRTARDLVDRRISPSGAVGASMVIAGGWASMLNPALVPTGGQGLDLFLGAIRSRKASETISNLAWFTSSDGGQNWGLFPGDLTTTGGAYTSDLAAALGSDGTPFEIWGPGSGCVCVHRGTKSATPNVDFQKGLGFYGYEPGMARDPVSGRLVAAWYSNGTGHTGVYAGAVDQTTGNMSGPRTRMPGTSNLLNGPLGGRTQIVARAGGGLYVVYVAGYPAQTKVLLWRVGSANSVLLAHKAAGLKSVGVATTPTGRLWVFWVADSPTGVPRVYARRSDTSAQAWGRPVAIAAPRHARGSWNLVGNGQAKRLDLVGSFSLGSSSNAASWYTQVLPGLALSASRRRLRTHTAHAQKVTFSVSDAGLPLSGVHVRVGQVSGSTAASGKVTLALGPFRRRTRLRAHATKTGYATDSLSIVVR